MSTRIELYFREFPVPQLAAKGVDIRVIRLFVDVRFRTHSGWTEPYSALLDTGSPILVVPLKVWSECLVNLDTDYVMRGIVPKEECSLPVLVGKIPCVLADRKGQSEELTVNAYFTLSDEVPLVVGFNGLLEKFKLCMDYSVKKAYLEPR